MQQTTEKGQEKDKDHPVFHYTVDGEPQETTEQILTPVQILSKAGLDASQYYLVEIIGNKQESFQNKPNDSIHMHEKMEFISVFLGSTPVS